MQRPHSSHVLGSICVIVSTYKLEKTTLKNQPFYFRNHNQFSFKNLQKLKIQFMIPMPNFVYMVHIAK